MYTVIMVVFCLSLDMNFCKVWNIIVLVDQVTIVIVLRSVTLGLLRLAARVVLILMTVAL